MSSMDEAAGRLAHHLAHPTARACLPPLHLRSGFFFSFSLGALVYIRSNGKRYLLGGGLGFTLALRYLASLGAVGWRGVHGKAGGRALCWGQSFAPGLGRPARHETETIIIRFVLWHRVTWFGANTKGTCQGDDGCWLESAVFL